MRYVAIENWQNTWGLPPNDIRPRETDALSRA